MTPRRAAVVEPAPALTLNARRHAAIAAARRILDRGPLAFGRVFTPHLMAGPPNPLHVHLNRFHRAALDVPPGRREAIAAPRGHGKSTAGVEVPALWHAAACTRRLQVIVSSTYEQAVARLATVVSEAENNADLLAAYPHLRPAYDNRGAVVAWRDDHVAFACGCRIVAVGVGKSIRGLKVGADRPDLVYLDDLEDEDSVATPKALAKRLRWITRVALGLAGPNRGLDALWVGTILSRSALIAGATGATLREGEDRPEWARDWRPTVYRAEVEGTARERVTVTLEDGKPYTTDVGAPFWDDYLTRADLAKIRGSIGSASYAAEYLNDPHDEAEPILRPPLVAGWVNPDAPLLARVIRTPDGRLIPVSSLLRAAGLDPQWAKPRPGEPEPDLAAIVVAGALGPDVFLLASWIGRDRAGQGQRAIRMAVEWGAYVIGVEANGAQVVLADEVAGSSPVPVKPLTPTAGKVERALALGVRLEQGHVYVLPDALELVEYLEAFPNHRFDDPVDATVYATDLVAHAARMSTSGPRLA